jgi:hypothetical protein
VKEAGKNRYQFYSGEGDAPRAAQEG